MLEEHKAMDIPHLGPSLIRKSVLCILLSCLGFSILLGEESTVRYGYDQAGRLISVEYSNGLTISYTYDKVGNLLRRSRILPLTYSRPRTHRPQVNGKRRVG